MRLKFKQVSIMFLNFVPQAACLFSIYKIACSDLVDKILLAKLIEHAARLFPKAIYQGKQSQITL